MRLGYAFREARLRKFPNREMNQADIAAKIKVTQSYLSQIESGNRVPSMDLMESLCRVYGITPAILFWMAMEPKDIKKSKLKAFEIIREPVNTLINEFFN